MPETSDHVLLVYVLLEELFKGYGNVEQCNRLTHRETYLPS